MRQAKPMKLTVSALVREGWHVYPESYQVALIQLCGKWLEEAGFYPGTWVRVDVVEEGRLVLTKVEEHEEDRQMQPVVWVPAAQIGKLESLH